MLASKHRKESQVNDWWSCACAALFLYGSLINMLSLSVWFHQPGVLSWVLSNEEALAGIKSLTITLNLGEEKENTDTFFSDRWSREESGTAPSAWQLWASRQKQVHPTMDNTDAPCSSPAHTSSTSSVWRLLRLFPWRADPPVPCADLSTTKNSSEQTQRYKSRQLTDHICGAIIAGESWSIQRWSTNTLITSEEMVRL